MRPKYFNPNWRLINEAIRNDSLKDLRQAQKKLSESIQSRVDAFYRAKKEADLLARIAELKALPTGSKVWFIGHDNKNIRFGVEFIIVSQGRTKVHVSYQDKRYTCPYVLLQNQAPTEQQFRDHRLGLKIIAIFTKAISHENII